MLPLHFDNFSIRPITINDAAAYFSLVDSNRERISFYFPFTSKINSDIESTTAHLAERMAHAEKNLFTILVITDNPSGKIVGAIIFKDIDWSIPKCELGFFMDKNYEGKGIMARSLSLVTDVCFNETELVKFFLRIDPENISSRRVAEKAGFLVEGIIRKDFKTGDGTLKDLVYYGLLQP